MNLAAKSHAALIYLLVAVSLPLLLMSVITVALSVSCECCRLRFGAVSSFSTSPVTVTTFAAVVAEARALCSARTDG